MKNFKLLIAGICAGVLVSSCGVTQDGFSSSSIQKRKYTKGFYHSKNHGFKKSHGSVTDEKVILNDDQTEQNEVFEDVSLESKKQVIKNNASVDLQHSEIKSDLKGNQEERQESSNKESLKKIQTSKSLSSNLKKKSILNDKLQKVKEFQSSPGGADLNIILLVILALIIPPLAVALYEGITKRFWIDLILALVGIGVGFWLFGGGIAYLCALVAVIYALLIVLEVI